MNSMYKKGAIPLLSNFYVGFPIPPVIQNAIYPLLLSLLSYWLSSFNSVVFSHIVCSFLYKDSYNIADISLLRIQSIRHSLRPLP